MKICIVEDFYRPFSSGGASEYVNRLTDALSSDGHDVIVITTSASSRISTQEKNGSITVYRLATHLPNIPIYTKKVSTFGRIPSILFYWFNPWVYRRIRKILSVEQPDVIHSFDTLYLSLSALYAIRTSGFPWAHSLLYVNLIKPTGILWNDRSRDGIGWWKLALPFTRKLVGSPNMIISPSRFSLSIHQQYGFFYQTPTAVVPLGPMHTIPSPERTQQQPRNFLSVGRMNYEKGTLTILRAFQRYRHPDLRLTIVGAGPDQEIITAEAKRDTRIVVKSHLSSEDLGKEFAAADVYISASRALETFNLTISEAFQAGMPVITSHVGAQPELVNTTCGLVFSAGNEQALGEAIRTYVEHPTIWSTHAAAARIRAHDFSMLKNIKQTLEIYQGLSIKKVSKA